MSGFLFPSRGPYIHIQNNYTATSLVLSLDLEHSHREGLTMRVRAAGKSENLGDKFDRQFLETGIFAALSGAFVF